MCGEALAAANARGIAWRIAQVYELPTLTEAEALERLLKARAHIRRYCLHCRAADRGDTPPVEPIIVPVVDLATFTGRKPIAEVVERRQLRLNRRAATRAAERVWYEAIHADQDETLTEEEAYRRGLYVSVYDLSDPTWTPAVAWLIDLIGQDFDLEAWRATL